MAREYFCAYHSLLGSLTPFGDAECGRLFRAALTYSATGEEMELGGNERFIWPTIKQMIDRDAKQYADKCKKNAENVRTRYERIRTNTNVYESYQEEEKEEDNYEEESKKESKPKKERTRFVPPTVEEVRAYCQERVNSVDPERFVDFYSSKGWKVGVNAMKDWKAAVRTWERSEDRKGPQKQTKIQPVVVTTDETDRLLRLTREMQG